MPWIRERYRKIKEEGKLLYTRGSESSRAAKESPRELAKRLGKYEILSFDVFDTLLFRPFSAPEDLFYLVGIKLGYPNFKKLRMQAEERARKEKYDKENTREVTFEEIWDVMERETGIPKEAGMQAEWETEYDCCYANPYMLSLFGELKKQKKRILAVSDMYLGRERIEKLLKHAGYGNFYQCFVSCDYKTSKSQGGLYEVVRKTMKISRGYIHIGDQFHSDYRQAKEHGMDAYPVINVNQKGNPYRTFSMSEITGSIYRGISNSWIYNGLKIYSREYEYGFLYGGLFAVGYCRYIHRYKKEHQIDRLLFLSRDGYVLLKVYRLLFPEEIKNTRYAFWSRLAALKITAPYFRQEYFQRFLYHKQNQKFTIAQILNQMELKEFLLPLCRTMKLEAGEELTNRNVEKVKKYLTDSWSEVLACYSRQQKAGGLYYKELLQDSKKAAAVDIGWAGSGALMLDYAVNQMWKLSCPVTGILAGAVGAGSPETSGYEPFFFQGKVTSYLYSQRENRDLWRSHHPEKGHNLYWELLLGAPQGSLKGFYLKDDNTYEIRLKEPPAQAERIRDIHRGILDFAELFLQTEQRLGMEIPVSGRDAYGPMLLAESEKNHRFMEELEDLMDDIHVG